jgi:hypothetical protein
VLVIEDTAEIQLAQENLVRFEARREQNGLPAVAIRDLLKAALRHRPTASSWERSAAAKPSISATPEHGALWHAIHDSCNSAQQGLARFTSCVLQSGVDFLTAPSRRTSLIRSMSSSMSSAGQDADISRKFSSSTATTRTRTCSITAQCSWPSRNNHEHRQQISRRALSLLRSTSGSFSNPTTTPRSLCGIVDRPHGSIGSPRRKP